MSSSFQTTGYALAGLAFLWLSIALIVGWRGRIHARWLTLATLVSATWGAVLAYSALGVSLPAGQVFLVELINDGAWLLLLSVFLGGSALSTHYRIVRNSGLALTVLSLALWLGTRNSAISIAADWNHLLYAASVLTSVVALVLLEQVFRNSRISQRRGLKFLCLGVGMVFTYDLILYTDAIISNQINTLLWSVRGFVVLMCVPLIGVAVARSPAWLGGVIVSRHVAFYSVTLIAVAVYMAVVGFLGYYVRVYGGDVGTATQLVFFSAAILVLTGLLISDHARARLKVFIAKHFYESKYDYRDEWLRLIDTLTAPEGGLSLQKRAIKSLAQVIDAPSGQLWLKSIERTGFQCVAGWNSNCGTGSVGESDSIIRFLQQKEWIIDMQEYRDAPGSYPALKIDPAIDGLSDASLIVPLLHDETLLGFVTVSSPRTLRTLNFEDHDLLRTAGKQIASYLAQELATVQLAESKQFEAFSRLTAYLMHDLKNLVAQQLLVVENAQKHKDKPAFVDDAVDTIRLGVIRLRRIIENLQQRSREQPVERTEMGKMMLQIVSQCGDRQPVPSVSTDDSQQWVWADRDRLMMAIYHVVRNAQDAISSDGAVNIALVAEGSSCVVTVMDTGSGMDESFIRDRLFRPFDSTKGTQGMGIGAYQMRETVRSMGGAVGVSSEPGSGTTVTITLPLAD